MRGLLALMLLLAGCAGAIGNIDLPYFGGDAGTVGLQAGATISVTWEDAPPGAIFYMFLWHGEPPLFIGIDMNADDGASVDWKVPENIGGKAVGFALFSDGTWRMTRVTSLDYGSGKAPPEGICVVHYSSNAAEVFDNNPNAGAYRILGYLRDYAPLLEIVDDAEGFRWYRVDLSDASVLSPLDDNLDVPETGWVYGIARLLGDCSGLTG